MPLVVGRGPTAQAAFRQTLLLLRRKSAINDQG
jgi:hypothetical protein